MPYSLKGKIKHKLERLVELGIYCPVASSKWAAPTVPMFKGDESIGICGNYKQTVNEAAECDKYPIPKTEDIFATLNGMGKIHKTRFKSGLSTTSSFNKFERNTHHKYTQRTL